MTYNEMFEEEYRYPYPPKPCPPRPPYPPKPYPPKPYPPPPPPPPSAQSHVHEFTGSTKYAGSTRHNHRFAGVTSEAILLPNGNHIHGYFVNTDFTAGHLHEISGETGPAIPVGEGRHVHFVEGTTTFNLGHDHEFVFATLIEDPTRE